MPQQVYRVEYLEDARADLSRLDKTVAVRIMTKIDDMAANIRAMQHKALKGEWAGLFRLRVDDYRVIYALDNKAALITVVQIGHRSSVYDE